jgi:hypothetical protein
MTVKSSKKGGKHDGINQKVAAICKVSSDYVAKIRAGDRGKRKTKKYEEVLIVLMEFAELENKLSKAASQIVDLSAQKPKRTPHKYGDFIK